AVRSLALLRTPRGAAKPSGRGADGIARWIYVLGSARSLRAATHGAIGADRTHHSIRGSGAWKKGARPLGLRVLPETGEITFAQLPQQRPSRCFGLLGTHDASSDSRRIGPWSLDRKLLGTDVMDRLPVPPPYEEGGHEKGD